MMKNLYCSICLSNCSKESVAAYQDYGVLKKESNQAFQGLLVMAVYWQKSQDP